MNKTKLLRNKREQLRRAVNWVWPSRPYKRELIVLLKEREEQINTLITRIERMNWTANNLRSLPTPFTSPDLEPTQKNIVDSFHKLLYDIQDSRLMRSYIIYWMGYEMLKWPSDLWVYQEIIATMRPDFIVETGTHKGGSALFLANVCDLLNNGQVITVDIDKSFEEDRPRHPRVKYLHGSSTDPEIFAKIKYHVPDGANAMVILDGDHQCDQVLAELRLYSQLIAPGGYLIAEDTNINGHPVFPGFGRGPWEAVEQFLAENSDFYIDHNAERFLITMNPSGFLRRREL